MKTGKMNRRKRITKIAALLMAVIMALLSSVISIGAITVTRDGRDYYLMSYSPTVGDINVLMIRLGFADYPADDEFWR